MEDMCDKGCNTPTCRDCGKPMDAVVSDGYRDWACPARTAPLGPPGHAEELLWHCQS